MSKYTMKYVLAGMAALTIAGAPLAAVAADDGAGMEKSDKMKGPPNANGAKNDDAKQGQSGGDNGAASAKATGADK